jgi:hypothetical protein
MNSLIDSMATRRRGHALRAVLGAGHRHGLSRGRGGGPEVHTSWASSSASNLPASLFLFASSRAAPLVRGHTGSSPMSSRARSQPRTREGTPPFLRRFFDSRENRHRDRVRHEGTGKLEARARRVGAARCSLARNHSVSASLYVGAEREDHAAPSPSSRPCASFPAS